MNFSVVKSITIPEGNVVKIESGGITLYRINTELVCNPVLSIKAYKGYIENKMTVETNISGISNSLINKLVLLHIRTSKITDPYNLKYTTQGRTALSFKKSNIESQDTVTGGRFRTNISNNTNGSSVNRYYRAYLDYTDLDGKHKTLYSDPIEAKYSTVGSI